MATIAGITQERVVRNDRLSGTPRAHPVDRWIYVAMAGWLVAIVLTGFIPDSLEKVAAVKAGLRPPFPMILHVHAALMGMFLLLLLAQTVLVATGRCGLHRRLGIAGVATAAALVIAGLLLAPTMYHLMWEGANAGPAAAREAAAGRLRVMENILLVQLRIGILFPLFIAIAVLARDKDAGLHKRMMILGTAVPVEAAIARVHWLPSTMPASPFSLEMFVLLAVTPMLIWDVVRNRSVHRAYWIWLAFFTGTWALVTAAWDKPWWHAAARALMGV